MISTAKDIQQEIVVKQIRQLFKKTESMDHEKINRTDLLAIERTKLANERTFLAYFRTCIVFLSSGFAILKIDMLHNLILLAYFFIIIAFLVMLIGIVRFFHVKTKINKYYH